ncbi:MAG UNVERIFIED_CONTAM: hypothetical protein LVR18_46685 [Planctomycetaceae bacterium]
MFDGSGDDAAVAVPVGVVARRLRLSRLSGLRLFVKSLPHKDVFTAINGQMITSLADNQRTDEAWTSNAFLNWPFGQRRHRDSTLPTGASILLSMMIVNMELSRLPINATKNHRQFLRFKIQRFGIRCRQLPRSFFKGLLPDWLLLSSVPKPEPNQSAHATTAPTV